MSEHAKHMSSREDTIIKCRASIFMKTIICITMAPIMIAAGAIIGLSIGFITLPVISIFLSLIILPINFVLSFELDFFLFAAIVIYSFITLGALAGVFVTIDLSRKLLSQEQ